tara:strand:+ start:1610 stop:2659 length:1050 start_codon:yes stop_codon:yes gene_type:complete
MASTIQVDKIKSTSGVTFTLPTADGSAGHLLKTNGSAVLSFTADTDTGILNVVEDTSPQLGGFLDANGNYIQMQKGGDIASASPTVIDTDGDYFICTGTTGFTTFTVAADRHFFLEFSGVLTMTHGAGTLDLPSGANITTAAGDVGEFVSTASNVVTCVNYTRATGKALVASHTATVGTATMWIPAIAMVSPDTNGAELAASETTATRPEIKVLDFDSSTREHAQFSVAMPKSWNLGTVTAKFYWTHATAVATDVIWGIQGVVVSDNDTIDIAYGTAVTVTDTFHNAAEDLAVTAATSAMTLAGTPADDDLAYFQVYRDAAAGGDTTNSTDARLLGVKILFTTDTENDD